MKTLIVYDSNGNIISSMWGTEIQDNYSCIVADIEEGKEIVSVDVSTGQVITKDKKPTEFEKLQTENEELTDKVIELTAQNLENAE
ncbi:hypothetical protein [Clostridium sp.]|uniref:hypothetical protein n=1 Tax=Clostridium sp. TaxID=1506 RepID=UPI002906FE47|nr:hypothetical protein [Clostridium sp.]MDU4846125.1 hypothetical protein [Clostridium sp.]